MNRRHFSGAMLGAGSLLLAGVAHSAAPAFAQTPGRADTTRHSTTRPSPEPASEDLTAHVASSKRRTYDRESPMSFVIATGIAMDRTRYAEDMYDNLLTTGITTFEAEGIVFDDDHDYGDLADHGHLYLGVIDLGNDAPVINVAVLYTKLGKVAYGIAAGSLDDPTALIDDYYETLFDEGRTETDLLLTGDEMPRGFTISEDIDDFVTEEDREGGRKGSIGFALAAPLGAVVRRIA